MALPTIKSVALRILNEFTSFSMLPTNLTSLSFMFHQDSVKHDDLYAYLYTIAPSLEYLSIGYSNFRDPDSNFTLPSLRRLTSLKSLILTGVRLEDPFVFFEELASLPLLAKIKLTYIVDVDDDQFSEAFLDYYSATDALTYLELPFDLDQQILDVISTKQKLRTLRIVPCEGMTRFNDSLESLSLTNEDIGFDIHRAFLLTNMAGHLLKLSITARLLSTSQIAMHELSEYIIAAHPIYLGSRVGGH
eukprot:gene12909-15164_t